MLCKECISFHSSNNQGVCTKRHIRVNDKSTACTYFSTADIVENDTRTCRTCKHHFIPEKDYPNLHFYYDYKGDYFLCKCKFHKEAKFLNKDYCKKYEKSR